MPQQPHFRVYTQQKPKLIMSANATYKKTHSTFVQQLETTFVKTH